MLQKKDNGVIKVALRVWLRLLFASILCGIVHVSVFALGTAAFSQVIGYQVYELSPDGEDQFLLFEHIYTDEEDRTQDLALEENQMMIQLREMPDGIETALKIVSSIIMLLIYCIFPYNMLWNFGDRIQNKVQYQHAQYDPWLGLKIGVVATVPSIVVYILLVLGKYGVFPDAVLAWHRILNVPFMPYIDAVRNGATAASELSIVSLLAIGLILLVVPAMCSIGYFLGYRHISVKDKIVYRNASSND